MSQQELLAQTVHALNDAGVEYMITGSVVSSFQGEPRSTHDIDLVVSINPSAVEQLLSAFPFPEYYLDKNMILDAMRFRGMFNLLHPSSGNKVDFWILKDTPYDHSRFARREREAMFGVAVWISAPEDTILSKLDWAKQAGGSEKQFVDALRVYEVQHHNLNHTYLREWVARLGVEELWQRLLNEAVIE